MKKVLMAFLKTLEEKDRIIEDMRGANRELNEYIRSREKKYEEAKAELEEAKKDYHNSRTFNSQLYNYNAELVKTITELRKKNAALEAELAVYKGESEANEDDNF